MNESVKVARINARQADKAKVWEVAKVVLSNPLALGLSALALNMALFRMGVYKGLPERSITGGPVWFTVGRGQDPATEYYSKMELFIMTVTGVIAAGQAVSAGSKVLSEVAGLLKVG